MDESSRIIRKWLQMAYIQNLCLNLSPMVPLFAQIDEDGGDMAISLASTMVDASWCSHLLVSAIAPSILNHLSQTGYHWTRLETSK